MINRIRSNRPQYEKSNFMYLKNQQTFMNFKIRKSSADFIFAIFSHHHTLNGTMIAVQKCQFVKQSTIYHRILLYCNFQWQCWRISAMSKRDGYYQCVTVWVLESCCTEVGTIQYFKKFYGFLRILKNVKNSWILWIL